MISTRNNVTVPRVGLGIQQVRYKRKLAYPLYKHNVPKQSSDKKDHSTFFQRAIKSWLGPKNIKGEYYRNKYYYPPQNHKPNYIIPDGNSVVGKSNNSSSPFLTEDRRRDSSLHPFPQNIYCKTASVIPDELKSKIVEEVKKNGLAAEEVAHKYGIKLGRIEAILKLQSIETRWDEQNKVSQDLSKFSEVMYKMFPLYQPPVGSDNLTEIPTPHKTLHQRFLTIAESEPFGPVDAAKILDLPVASETLAKLSEVNSDEETKAVHNEVVVGIEKKDDRTAFKFTKSNVGSVGYRYGASRRDQKKDRRVGFDSAGNMVYI
ncbi:eukaryotic mitochondrial regulator protein-domain-containing protein [Scheffersomyces amazonensis]|uniref:eukaryotic mitochondrial regulator protein-domain-containing protein n=1 Tax=Scheffersomyces amazonensis TaxID=1078765 RepID=UPI00315D7C53